MADRANCAVTSAAPDQAAACRQLEAIGILRTLIDFDDFAQTRTWIARGGVEMTEAAEVRNELLGRRLSAIAGLTADDVEACSMAIIPHLTDDQCDELLKIFESWPSDD